MKLIALLTALNAIPALTASCAGYDCLKEYVDRPDSSFAWRDTGIEFAGEGWTGHVLNMTSQTWLTSEDSSQSVWWHNLVVIIPHGLESADTGILYIEGRNNDQPESPPDVNSYGVRFTARWAVDNGLVGAVLFQVPNQPIEFPIDPAPKPRTEDELLSLGWWHFLNVSRTDTDWIFALPMTKAGVRAMDAVTEYLGRDDDLINPVNYFVAGVSKRGWTTWRVSAVDPRVIGIVPIVMDELNFVENLKHHWRTLGGWSFALQPYWEMGISALLTDVASQDLFDITDPYAYKEKLNTPKLVVNAANDEFFLPTDTRYWWMDMPDATALNRFLLVPNATHSANTYLDRVVGPVSAWMNEILAAKAKLEAGGSRPPSTIEERGEWSRRLMAGAAIPQLTWGFTEQGEIAAQTNGQPVSVQLVAATTCDNRRRDFRYLNIDNPCLCGESVALWGMNFCQNNAVHYYPRELEEIEPGNWLGYQAPPSGGKWTAFYLIFKYPLVEGAMSDDQHLMFTTTVAVTPDTFPVGDCEGEECKGHLV